MIRRILVPHERFSLAIVAGLLLVAESLPAGQSVIQGLTFSGNTAFTSRQLLEGMSSIPSRTFSPTIFQNDLRAILERYRKAGYLDVTNTVEMEYSQDSARVDVHVVIHEGRRAVVGGILLTGHRVFSTGEIISRFDVRVGDPLDESQLEEDIENLLARYEHAGYPIAQCRVEDVVRRVGVETDSIDLTIAIDEGRQVTIEEIQVHGNNETDPSVVVRETRLRVGETFTPAKVDAIRQRLQRLNIFSDVADPELYMRDNRAGLRITVKEGSTNTFDGVIGYIPSTISGDKGYLTGLASIAMRNLFGTGRKLSFQWQREDKHSQELGVRYVEPWLFGNPVNLGGGFFQRQQDTSYVRRVIDLKAELMLSEELSASLLFGSESVIPSVDSGASRVFRSVTTSFGAEVLYDTRDDVYSPTSGARYRSNYSFGHKRFRGIPAALISRIPGTVTVQQFALDLDVYLSTFFRQVIAVGIHGRELQSGQLEEGEMFRLGGTRTLRGYRENQFMGSRIAWSNAEYRFLLARRSFIFGFLDGGYYFRPEDEVRSIARSDAFKYGYGIGVQLETGLGNLGVSFALGQGDSFSNGKIHFGLVNEF